MSSAGKLYVADTYNHSIRVAIPQLRLVSAVSRKTHGTAGTFDIDLPLTGAPGVECRSSGGNHTLVFTFDNNMMSGNASVISGVGSVSGSPMFSANTMTVNLTGVTDVQQITLKLSSVSDAFAQVLADTSVSVNMLAGDTSGNKTVNSTDVSQTKLQSGAPVNAANFREDVVVSDSINATDVSLVNSPDLEWFRNRPEKDGETRALVVMIVTRIMGGSSIFMQKIGFAEALDSIVTSDPRYQRDAGGHRYLCFRNEADAARHAGYDQYAPRSHAHKRRQGNCRPASSSNAAREDTLRTAREAFATCHMSRATA